MIFSHKKRPCKLFNSSNFCLLVNRSNKRPSIDNLLEKQTKTQQICDNLEYQDKVKSEKIRLEKNKQYLLKLKEQQQQVDQLNQVIQTLETNRLQRDKTADMSRILQYQNQKGIASSVRDLANQRLESQSNNQLYLDTNMDAGHGGASGRFEAIKEIAKEYSFLLDLEGIKK